MMGIDKEVIYGLVNISTMLFTGCGAEYLWFRKYYPFCFKGEQHYLVFLLIKLSFVNLFTNVFLDYYFNDQLWFSRYSLIVNICGFFLSIYLYVIVFAKRPMVKAFLLFMLGEFHGAVIGGGTVLIVNKCINPSFMTDYSLPPSRYNLYMIIIGYILTGVDLTLLHPIWEKSSKGKIKYERFWTVFSILCGMAGLYSQIAASYWTGFYIIAISLTIATIFLIIIISYLVYQKISSDQLKLLNKVLFLQQNIMKDHYNAMEEQMQIMTKLREVLFFQMEDIHKFIQRPDVLESIESYINSLKIQQMEGLQSDYWNYAAVDHVLHNKTNIYENEQITISSNLSSVKWKKVREMDLFNVTYLLIDYMAAICMQMESDNRWIDLQGVQEEGQILLDCRCSAPEKRLLSHDLFSMSKRKESRGFSIAMLKRIVYEYGGEINGDHQGAVYRVVIEMRNI